MAIKAKTKAQKRRGRKKVLDVPREPNGRRSRSGIPHEAADKVAIQARMRHTGLPKAKARDQKAATFIGYLNLLGRRDGLSDDQYEAALHFIELRRDFLRSIKAPDATLDNGMVGSAGDEISDGYIEWCKSIKQRYLDCREAIQEAQNESRSDNLWAALDYCIIRDEWHRHMVPSLRVLCNALNRFFRG